MSEETLITATPEAEVAAAAKSTVVDTAAPKATDVVADAAKAVKETTQDDDTLLGEEQIKEAKNVPEKYEFKVPEGMELDLKTVDQFTPVFKEIGLSQEQAQKLVDAYAPYVKTQLEKNQTEAIDYYKNTVNEWKTETQKELGAESPKKLAVASKAINKLGTPALREILNETGVGNHKEVVKFFIKVGELIGEDHFVESKQTSGGKGLPAESVLFPSMNKT